MNSLKYSILFMRDDTDVRRFRVSSVWLKIFVCFQSFLLLFSIFGISIGMTFWSNNFSLRAERKALELQLSEAELKLERLSNMEKLMETSRSKDLLHVVQVGLESVEVLPRHKLTPINLKALFEQSNTGLVTVERFQARISGNGMIVNFGMTNVKSISMLAGMTEITLIRNDGQILYVEANKADLSFQIQRFQNFRTFFNLPKGLDRRDIFGLCLEIKDYEGKTIFRNIYQFCDPMVS